MVNAERALHDENRPPPRLCASTSSIASPGLHFPPVPAFLPSKYNEKNIKSLRKTVSYHKTALKSSRTRVLALKEENRQLRGSLETSHLNVDSTSQQLDLTQNGLKATTLALSESKKTVSSLIFSSNAYLAWTHQEHAAASAIASEDFARLSMQNKLLSSKVSVLRKQNRRSHESLQRSLKWKREHMLKYSIRLKSKGVYTPRARAIMRTLVTAGCSQKNIGSVIKSVGGLFGFDISDNVSKRTVRRAIIEGGVASSIQVGHALTMSNCKFVLCFSTPPLLFHLSCLCNMSVLT